MPIAPSRTNSIEAAGRDAVGMDVPKDTANNALYHEVANASGLVATVDGGLHSVGDRVHHRVHGRYGVGHLLPWVRTTLGRFPTNSLSGVPLPLFAQLVRTECAITYYEWKSESESDQ
jgi:hypothetical protein